MFLLPKKGNITDILEARGYYFVLHKFQTNLPFDRYRKYDSCGKPSKDYQEKYPDAIVEKIQIRTPYVGKGFYVLMDMISDMEERDRKQLKLLGQAMYMTDKPQVERPDDEKIKKLTKKLGYSLFNIVGYHGLSFMDNLEWGHYYQINFFTRSHGSVTHTFCCNLDVTEEVNEHPYVSELEEIRSDYIKRVHQRGWAFKLVPNYHNFEYPHPTDYYAK